jgi:hypothetical protein
MSLLLIAVEVFASKSVEEMVLVEETLLCDKGGFLPNHLSPVTSCSCVPCTRLFAVCSVLVALRKALPTLPHENEGLRNVLTTKKKHKKKGETLNLQQC